MELEDGHSAASVDWLTMTVKDRAKRELVASMVPDHVARLEEAGYERIDYFSHGYSGVRIGGLTYGQRQDDDIVRLSGNEAGVYWRTWGKHANNISRLDLQVTHRLKDGPRLLARRVYDALEGGEIVLKKARGQSIIENSLGGSTLYVGSRTSEVYLRLYDKGVEAATETPGWLWRWEVELKDAYAMALHSELTNHTSSPTILAGHVWRVWNERGIPPPWIPTADTVAPYVTRALTDEARKLAWLRSQVAPTVAWLTRRGKAIEVLEALGVD